MKTTSMDRMDVERPKPPFIGKEAKKEKKKQRERESGETRLESEHE